jgi:hypothetical protein
MTGNHPNMATDPSGMIDPAVLQMWSDWVWGKNREVSKAMDSVQRNAPITRIDVHMGAQVIRGVSGYVAHEATVMRGEPGSQQRQGAFAGGFIANSSPVAMYDLYNNPQVVFNRAIGLNDDTELAADSIMQSAESMDVRHANYGHDFVPLFEMEMDAVSSLGMVNSLTTAPLKLGRMSPHRLFKWLNKVDNTLDATSSSLPDSIGFRINIGESLDLQDARAMLGDPVHDFYNGRGSISAFRDFSRYDTLNLASGGERPNGFSVIHVNSTPQDIPFGLSGSAMVFDATRISEVVPLAHFKLVQANHLPGDMSMISAMLRQSYSVLQVGGAAKFSSSSIANMKELMELAGFTDITKANAARTRYAGTITGNAIEYTGKKPK